MRGSEKGGVGLQDWGNYTRGRFNKRQRFTWRKRGLGLAQNREGWGEVSERAGSWEG